mmetsp:Transcript_55759/g.132926  ORF Transcript_55759/g.132926 Transcript_55759/m.132926 type:complete len:140 (-) Transcript_55759:38-457(-)
MSRGGGYESRRHAPAAGYQSAWTAVAGNQSHLVGHGGYPNMHPGATGAPPPMHVQHATHSSMPPAPNAAQMSGRAWQPLPGFESEVDLQLHGAQHHGSAGGTALKPPADNRSLEEVLAELRKEVDRLDDDAWMFKKLPS